MRYTPSICLPWASAVRTRSSTPDLAHACPDLLLDGNGGIWHLANAGEMSYAELARSAMQLAGLDPGVVLARLAYTLESEALRPR